MKSLILLCLLISSNVFAQYFRVHTQVYVQRNEVRSEFVNRSGYWLVCDQRTNGQLHNGYWATSYINNQIVRPYQTLYTYVTANYFHHFIRGRGETYCRYY